VAEKSAESTVGNYLGAPIGGAFTALATWAMAGSTGAISPALVSLLSVAGGICGLALTLLYRRYLGILGANRRVAAERQAYDALRNSLVEGNLAARLYAERLTGFLDWIDHFFGDAGMTGRTLFPRAFGLRTPAPLWTAPAFGRCLRLALFYPILTIFVIWAVSGHVGPAERVLLLEPNLTGVQRSLALAFIGFSIFVWRYYKLTISRTRAVSVAFVLCVAVAGFTAGPGSFGVVVAGAGLSAGVPSVGSGLAIAPVAGPVIAVAVTIALAAAGATVVLLMMKSIEHRLYGVFLSLFLPAMILACLAAAGLMSPLRDWKLSGPMLLFLGLLTLLNAPFD
jgi:hypothetical protein